MDAKQLLVLAELIDRKTSDGDYRPRDVADEIYTEIRQDPQYEKAIEYLILEGLVNIIRKRNSSQRSKVAHDARSGAFRAIVHGHEAGDASATERLHGLMDMTFTIGGGIQRRLGDMRRDDLTFAASDYRRQIATHALYALFLDQLAAHVGDRQVSDVYTEEQLATMFGSLAHQSS